MACNMPCLCVERRNEGVGHKLKKVTQEAKNLPIWSPCGTQPKKSEDRFGGKI
jgi:hypothetical protein